MDDSPGVYAFATLSYVSSHQLPAEVNRSILNGGDPYGILWNIVELQLSVLGELGNRDLLPEVRALIELDAAGVRMDLVSLIIRMEEDPSSGSKPRTPTQVLSAYRSGEDLSLLVPDLHGYDQHRDQARDPLPGTLDEIRSVYEASLERGSYGAANDQDAEAAPSHIPSHASDDQDFIEAVSAPWEDEPGEPTAQGRARYVWRRGSPGSEVEAPSTTD